MGEKWLTRNEAAAFMGVKTCTIDREIRRGNLDAVHVGRVVRIPSESIADYKKKFNYVLG